MGPLNPSREAKFSGTYGDRGIFIFPVQLTTSRIGNLIRLIYTLLNDHKYIHIPLILVLVQHRSGTLYVRTWPSINSEINFQFENRAWMME